MYNAAHFTQITETERDGHHNLRIATEAARLAMSVDDWKAPELCPPHWRLPPKRSLRSKLKPATNVPSRILGRHNSRRTSRRPPIMRMKDSDDYITARAANPRTGLISPSVGTRTPCTPDSPGEALRLRTNDQTLPTPDFGSRTVKCRANQGRKIGNVSKQEAPPREHRRHSSRQGETTTPTTGRFDALDGPERRDSVLKDDQFVVHMPSAREPQPFMYPGYTPEQIEALKHYRQKTRRVSSEGYDQRLLRGSGQHSSKLDEGFTEDDLYALCPGVPGQPSFKPYRYEHTQTSPELSRITVRKRKTPRSDTNMTSNEPRRFVDKLEAKAATLFAPFASPKKTQHVKEPASTSREIPRTVPQHNACRATEQLPVKSIGSAPSPSAVVNPANVDHHHGEALKQRSGSGQPPICVPGSFEVADLSCLPRVKLVRPELAAVPRATLPTGRDKSRECSLSCQRDNNGQEKCAEIRDISSATVIHRRVSSYAEPADQHESGADILGGPKTTLSAEMLVDLLRLFLSSAKSLEMPKVAVIETLSSSEASTTEKMIALKQVLSLAAHALAICTTLAMLWKLGAAIMHLLEVLLWPLMVPLRILRWIGGLG